MVGVLLGCQTLGEPKARPTGDAPSSAPASAPKRERAEADLLSNVRQLIFDGRRSGEGYFSKDGRQLIFQSEREASNPFYQIYRLDLETGDTERVSPGIGKTTCSWVHPDGRSYLFSSTHEDPDAKREMKAELAFRASGKTRRYSWDYDEYFDIYRKDGATGAYVNLTNTRGYDAEASYAPDGAKIAFASNRRAYAGAMSDADKKAFARDPAYMMDIYIMDADGAGVTRLTEAPGYDGGPFFSPDGQRIVWRRFNPEGDKAEVWSMKLDGSDKRAITRLEHMSWAPYYHPSGDYLIFTTNVHGFNNFELYMVDAEGTKKPVRVTFTPGWDGLPVFSPDGRKLAWSTGRTEDKKPQIFLADWDDGAARELLSLSPGRDEVAYRGPAADVSARIDGTTPKIVAQDVRRHVDALTDPAMNGRLTGTPGEARATAYVASAFAQLGLQPAGDGGWFQPFEFTSGVTLGEPNVLLVQAKDTTTRPPVDEAWRPLAFSKPGSFARRRLVFAGYGVVARAADGQPAYDAYGDLDVKDKMVVVLRYLPKDIDPDRRAFLSRFASLRYKAMEARDRGAKGLIVVTGPSATAKQRLVPLRFDAAIAGTGIPAISVSDAVGAEIFARAGHDLKAAQAALDGGRAVAGFALPGTQIGGHLTLNLQKATGRNVVGRLQVGDARSDQVVVIGAHVDHLGRGDGGDSLAKPEERGQIHPGADDNASGVAGLLEIAQSLAHRRQNGSLAGARRDVVFAAWSGEELGLYGSTHWVKAALRDAPSANGDAPSLQPKVAAYLNMDMIGRLRQQAVLQGVGSSAGWRKTIERRNVVVGLPLKLVNDAYLPTDATAFYLRGVPIVSAFTGVHGDYHTPRDTAEHLNYDGAAKIARLLALIAEDVTKADAAPAYVKVAPPKNRGSRRTSRVYLGTIPEYASADVKGVKLSGVSNEGPAAKAGLKSGDVIVELAGRKLANIYDYVKALDSLTIGRATTVVVERNGRRISLPITPAAATNAEAVARGLAQPACERPPAEYSGRVPNVGPIYTETLLHARLCPNHWLVEPYNAASAGLFVAVAVYWLLKVSGQRQVFLTYAAFVLGVGGIGGTLYHGLRTHRLFLLLDVLPILILAISTVYWFVGRMSRSAWMAPVYTFGGLIGIIAVVRLIRTALPDGFRGPVVGYGMLGVFVIVPMVLFVVRTRFRDAALVFTAIACFVVGMFFRAVDRSWLLPMGTHFLWHTLGAVMTHLMLLYLWRVRDVRLVPARSA